MAIDTRAKRLGFIAIPGITPMFPGDGTIDARDRRHLNDCLAVMGGQSISFVFWRQDDSSSSNLTPDSRVTGNFQAEQNSPDEASWKPQAEVRDE